MGNVFWAFLAPPVWYIMLMNPVEGRWLSLIPVTGVLGLLAGISLGIRSGERRLLLFIVPFVLSEIFLAPFWFAQERGVDCGDIVFIGFATFQLIACAYLIFIAKGARLAALALSLFSSTYALFIAVAASGLAEGG